MGLALLLALALLGGCATPVDLVGHRPLDEDLRGLVDSEPARHLLADLLGRRADADLTAAAGDAPLVGLGRGGVVPLPTQAELHALGQQVSVDYAALTFARALGADGRSRAVQGAYERFVREGGVRSAAALRPPGAFPYTVLFVPSWLYVSHPETGADFANGRRALGALGISNRMVLAGESDSVEANAAAIVTAIRQARRDGLTLVVVSASKSGAETALALSRLLTPEEIPHVAAWVNLVGALRGTPLADTALRPPASWVSRAICWVNGWNFEGVSSMATEPSRRRLAGARLPESVAVVNVVGITLSGTVVGRKVYHGYRVLLDQGPNDGVVLLGDTVWPGGANIAVLGADHLFAPREDEGQVLALMRAVDLAVRLHRHPLAPAVIASED